MRVFVVLAIALLASDRPSVVLGEEPQRCEAPIVGNLYQCESKVSDPAGICYRYCVAVTDSHQQPGFDLSIDDGFGATNLELHCECNTGPDGVTPMPGSPVQMRRRRFTGRREPEWRDDESARASVKIREG